MNLRRRTADDRFARSDGETETRVHTTCAWVRPSCRMACTHADAGGAAHAQAASSLVYSHPLVEVAVEIVAGLEAHEDLVPRLDLRGHRGAWSSGNGDCTMTARWNRDGRMMRAR